MILNQQLVDLCLVFNRAVCEIVWLYLNSQRWNSNTQCRNIYKTRKKNTQEIPFINMLGKRALANVPLLLIKIWPFSMHEMIFVGTGEYLSIYRNALRHHWIDIEIHRLDIVGKKRHTHRFCFSSGEMALAMAMFHDNVSCDTCNVISKNQQLWNISCYAIRAGYFFSLLLLSSS